MVSEFAHKLYNQYERHLRHELKCSAFQAKSIVESCQE